jgi:hypothetical protein
MTNDLTTTIDVTNTGISVIVRSTDSEKPVFETSQTWETILETVIQENTIDGQDLHVDENYDGVKSILDVVDILRERADELEETLRSKKIVANTYTGRQKISFREYIRGEF